MSLYSYMIRKNSATGANTVIRKNEDSLKVLEQIKNDCKSEKKFIVLHTEDMFIC